MFRLERAGLRRRFRCSAQLQLFQFFMEVQFARPAHGSETSRCHAEGVPETPGEIVAVRESALYRDLGDRHIRIEHHERRPAQPQPDDSPLVFPASPRQGMTQLYRSRRSAFPEGSVPPRG